MYELQKAQWWLLVFAFVFGVAFTLIFFLEFRQVDLPFLLLVSIIGAVVIVEMTSPYARRGRGGIRFPDEGFKHADGAKPVRNPPELDGKPFIPIL